MPESSYSSAFFPARSTQSFADSSRVLAVDRSRRASRPFSSARFESSCAFSNSGQYAAKASPAKS
ncbi:hypothetical protein [Streptomyces sp. 8N616]|uniref:hypothetical protein n=1 Tax=Streptomyces sp. 8N616 TaxID=3457414 RepID=UPI003FD5ABEB